MTGKKSLKDERTIKKEDRTRTSIRRYSPRGILSLVNSINRLRKRSSSTETRVELRVACVFSKVRGCTKEGT